MGTSDERPATPVDEIANRYFAASTALSPTQATYLGVGGGEGELDDFSPRGWAAHESLRRRTLADLDDVTPVDDIDRVTVSALRDTLTLASQSHEAGLDEMALNNIASPFQSVRDVLDLMPTDTEQDWSHICSRLRAIPTALAQWHESLMSAADRGLVAPVRQVSACLEQGDQILADDGYLARFRQRAQLASGPLPEALATDLDAAVAEAARGYDACLDRLRTVIMPLAGHQDAVGRDVYQLCSRQFLGAVIDLEDTYAWGMEELARIRAEMTHVADGLVSDGGIPAAMASLDAQPRYRLDGVDALQRWMQDQAEGAIDALAGVHFDIPEPVRRIECLISPSQTGGIYYTGPSDDFSRPGRMWWSVARGVTQFSTWRELTTVYHEGVPGHHLQVGQTVYRSALLNRWRRLLAWTSGHGEGWALYAERLMRELGFMDDPGNLLGLLDAQSLRAARVVLDIGVHCGLPVPVSLGGGRWTYERAWEFLTANSSMPESTLRFELDRYLGWPGQAPSYKVGERLWLELRAEAQRREGAQFSLKEFHRRSLDIGGVGLDTLRKAVLGELDD
ncbi:MAG: DUF885 domain-containing protein [Austwickia sp.]|nr:DUF885 domain-containing protein [Austwickia sp.]MBK8436779.1 DUF885 domain-containing protein [Austwickia sp.]MBK9100408.1 DUF885 domain-containing protein [Austwickia sp.]